MSPELLVDCPERSEPLLITAEKERQIKDALNVINAVSSMVGKELEVTSVNSHEDITQDPGVYLLRHPEYSSRVKQVHFDFERNLLSGAADSAHAVLQGNLFVERTKRREGSQHKVAVKNFAKRNPTENMGRALKEVRIMEDMQSKGELSFKPIGLVVTPESEATNGEIILLTKHDRSILTMDNNPWKSGPTPNNMENALLAAEAVGRFNIQGYFHNDAKIKNVAQKEIGQTGMIDYETAQDIDITDSRQSAEAALVDFSTFLDSLHKKEFFRRAIGTPRLKQLLDDLAFRYLEAWEDADIDVQTVVMKEVDTVVDQYITQHSPVYLHRQ